MNEGLKDRICILFFRPRTRPKTFLQCFALYFLCSKAKHCRNVLGRVNHVTEGDTQVTPRSVTWGLPRIVAFLV